MFHIELEFFDLNFLSRLNLWKYLYTYCNARQLALHTYLNIVTYALVGVLQGYELTINNRKFFAFARYQTMDATRVMSLCNETFLGWSHDILGHDWACYLGQRVSKGPSAPTDLHFVPRSFLDTPRVHLRADNYRCCAVLCCEFGLEDT